MSLYDGPKPTPKKRDDNGMQNGIRVVKTTIGVGQDMFQGHPEKAVTRAIATGIKLADESVFRNPLTSPMRVLAELKAIGINCLAWEPETLMSVIDRKYHGWTDERLAAAIEKFNSTGIIETDVAPLVRQKIYALRVLSTSDSPHNEWHIFEKVGAAFNDRIPQFGTMEPLSAAECARTVTIMEQVRPDEYSNEVKIYIAAACHQDGLLTVQPIPSLVMCEPYLEQMNTQEMSERPADLKAQICAKYADISKIARTLKDVPDEVVTVQALKLLSVEIVAQDALLT